jgi:hypothetical protein
MWYVLKILEKKGEVIEMNHLQIFGPKIGSPISMNAFSVPLLAIEESAL